jgi:hypothetical protein
MTQKIQGLSPKLYNTDTKKEEEMHHNYPLHPFLSIQTPWRHDALCGKTVHPVPSRKLLEPQVPCLLKPLRGAVDGRSQESNLEEFFLPFSPALGPTLK